jgi:hypothetical protein
VAIAREIVATSLCDVRYSSGTRPALSERVNLYDVLADGYHTPLTKTQITELFQAGRLGRNQPCKQIEKKEWRTVDELFPLLKYDSARQYFYQPTERHSSQARNGAFAIAISALAILGVSLGAYFGLRGEAHAIKDAGIAEVPNRLPDRVTTSVPTVDSANVNAVSPANVTQPDDFSRQARLAQERLMAAQRQREQSQAVQLAQDRANAEQRERERQKATGRTVPIPLDQSTLVSDVGGSNVIVKIHDHDITTIDVWIGYGGPLRLTKQKGITDSGTDETLIYSNGRAHLYYVWEISGKLNHCLLRVRED